MGLGMGMVMGLAIGMALVGCHAIDVVLLWWAW
jgi:hypothetical protein